MLRPMIGGLNTLRYSAFFFVFLYHTGGSYFSWGKFGVAFFFVLSSFLLTHLALDEYQRTGRVSSKNFLIRRALRIFPLYYLFLIIIFLLLPLLGWFIGGEIYSSDQGWMYWTFLANYDYSDSIYPLKFLWSISVEEQFYLFFGLIGIFLVRKRNTILLLVASLLVVFAIHSFYSGGGIYTHTLTQLPNFIVGILLGYLYNQKKNVSGTLLIATILASFGVLWFTDQGWILFVVSSIFFGSILMICVQYWHLIHRFPLFQFTEYWGVYTYGLYVYSGLIILMGWYLLHVPHWVQSLIAFVSLHAIAWGSYHLFEKRFLHWKRKFRD